MAFASWVVCGLLCVFNLQLSSTYPVSTSLTSSDMDILRVLLNRFEELLPEQRSVNPVDDTNTEADAQQVEDPLDEASIREFLSAKNLKSVRSDSTRRASACFGRRIDRIGSMSSLGCNSVNNRSK
nr:natriuretic peptides B [Nerophis lumbriciformis]